MKTGYYYARDKRGVMRKYRVEEMDKHHPRLNKSQVSIAVGMALQMLHDPRLARALELMR